MACLGSRLYDPATAVTVNVAAGAAMTAFDTTNLRITFTVPSTGRVLVRLQVAATGGSAAPAVFLGVMDGSTVVARVAALGERGTVASTTSAVQESVFTVSGLTPGASLTWDAAYGVETSVSGATLRYGGPNDTLTGNAWGAFVYEIWEA